MEWISQTPFVAEALAGISAAHVTAALTRGGRGVLTRTLAGLVGGVGVVQGLPLIGALLPTLEIVYSAAPGAAGHVLGDLALGGAGGALAGLIVGLLWPARG